MEIFVWKMTLVEKQTVACIEIMPEGTPLATFKRLRHFVPDFRGWNHEAFVPGSSSSEAPIDLLYRCQTGKSVFLIVPIVDDEGCEHRFIFDNFFFCV